jgi:hypothetical protein
MSRMRKLKEMIDQEENNYMGGIIARGYCTKENSEKVVDPTLIKAIVKHLRREGYHRHDDIDCTKCTSQIKHRRGKEKLI